MLTAMLAVENIFGAKNDLWSVNVERSYHEEFEVASNKARNVPVAAADSEQEALRAEVAADSRQAAQAAA